MEIEPQTAAVDKKLLVQKYHVGSTLMVVGDISTDVITVEVPLVADPDESTDAEWQQMTYDGTSYQLDSNNLVLPIDSALNYIRLNKPVTTNAVGVYWKL